MQITKEEMAGIHKGALITLISEQQELARLLSIVNQLIQVHNKALKEMGIDFEAELKKRMEEEAKRAQQGSNAQQQGQQTSLGGRLG